MKTLTQKARIYEGINGLPSNKSIIEDMNQIIAETNSSSLRRLCELLREDFKDCADQRSR